VATDGQQQRKWDLSRNYVCNQLNNEYMQNKREEQDGIQLRPPGANCPIQHAAEDTSCYDFESDDSSEQSRDNKKGTSVNSPSALEELEPLYRDPLYTRYREYAVLSRRLEEIKNTSF